MNEENQTYTRVPEADTQKGQAMYIYLPEGAVIVDRTQVNVAGIPQAEQTSAPITPEQPPVQYMQPQPGVAYMQPQPGVAYMQPQPRVQYVQQPNVAYAQPQVQYAQPQVQYAQPQPGVAFLQDRPSVEYRRRRRDHLVLRRRQGVDWLHTMNVIFATYIAAVTIVPLALSSLIGITLFSSKTNNAGLTITRGELMVAHSTSVNRLIPGDIILLRDKNSWNLQVRQLVSTSANGNLTSVFTNAGVDGTVSDVTTIDSSSSVRKVTSSIPFFGYVVTIFGTIFVKFWAAMIVLALNIGHMYRRRRRRIIDEKVVFVPKDQQVRMVDSFGRPIAPYGRAVI
jgi:hypothetical protein